MDSNHHPIKMWIKGKQQKGKKGRKRRESRNGMI